MSDSVIPGEDIGTRGRREAGSRVSRSLAPSSHVNPALAAAVKKSTGIRADASRGMSQPPVSKSQNEKLARLPLSPQAAETVRAAVLSSGRQDSALRKAEASGRLAQSAVDAAAVQKLKVEEYNHAVQLYFDRVSKTPSGQCLDRFARRNGLTRTQAAQAVAEGDAAKLGASPEEEAELSQHVGAAQKDPGVKRSHKAMIAGGFMLALAARAVVAEHNAYATDPSLNKESLPQLEAFGKEVSSSMREEMGGATPINLGAKQEAPSILDTMETSIQETMIQTFERLGEIGAIPLKMAN